MKNKIIALIILFAAVFAASAYLSRSFWLHYMPWGTGGQAGHAVGAKDDQCKTVYTCPMHHQIIRDSPGDCPICGMTLVKKEVGARRLRQRGKRGERGTAKGMGGVENMSSTPGTTPAEQSLKTVTLDPRERMLANVATTEAREESISQEVDTVGKIAMDERISGKSPRGTPDGLKDWR